MYEVTEHTADVGLHIRHRELAGLFADAAHALMSLLVSDVKTITPSEHETIELKADRLDDLLSDWLSELLYLFATKSLVALDVKATVDGTSLKADVTCGRFDPNRHEGGIEVKAITYHGLRLDRTEDGYEAELIVDI